MAKRSSIHRMGLFRKSALLSIHQALILLAFTLFSSSINLARADEYGCQVLLCLSNPGGPTQYGECVPPIDRLWSDLRHFRGFPTCSGVGYSTTSPVYDPYYCAAPASLVFITDWKEHGSTDRAVCQTKLAQPICTGGHDGTCEEYSYSSPYVREKPHWFDLSIEGRGVQRIWF